MQAHVGITTNEWPSTGSSIDQYGLDTIRFDANGNIDYLYRNGNLSGSGLRMDHLEYHYYPNTNRLEYVTDTVNPVTYSNDIDDQASGNYTYDPIGNLISDVAEGITAIEWYVNGKIKGITRSSATQSRPHLAFSYGPDGQRIRKVATWSTGSDTTWYVRDAQGNPMAVYWQRNDSLFAKEHYLYGSSRLGSIHDSTFVTTLDPHSDTNRYARTLGLKYFELSNHLGNVLATVSDQKISVEKSGSVDYYLPKVVSYSDYYPFGMQMEGRSGGTDYRFGFNGMELDNEAKGHGNHYTTEWRQYDPRNGRWFSIDPIIKYWESSYAWNTNNPIVYIDPSGKDGVAKINLSEEKQVGKRTYEGGSKKNPHTLTVSANYYYNKEQLGSVAEEAFNEAIAVYNSSKHTAKGPDGQYYKIVFNLNSIAVEQNNINDINNISMYDCFDCDIEYKRFGNNVGRDFLKPTATQEKEDPFGIADERTISLHSQNIAMMVSQGFSEKDIMRNTFIHEIGHNLGGIHGDGGMMSPLQLVTSGQISMQSYQISTKVVEHVRLTPSNVQKIINRVWEDRDGEAPGKIHLTE